MDIGEFSHSSLAGSGSADPQFDPNGEGAVTNVEDHLLMRFMTNV